MTIHLVKIHKLKWCHISELDVFTLDINRRLLRSITSGKYIAPPLWACKDIELLD